VSMRPKLVTDLLVLVSYSILMLMRTLGRGIMRWWHCTACSVHAVTAESQLLQAKPVRRVKGLKALSEIPLIKRLRERVSMPAGNHDLSMTDAVTFVTLLCIDVPAWL
jgi:hypothetical protein